jgi:hypothetical protein
MTAKPEGIEEEELTLAVLERHCSQVLSDLASCLVSTAY